MRFEVAPVIQPRHQIPQCLKPWTFPGNPSLFPLCKTPARKKLFDRYNRRPAVTVLNCFRTDFRTNNQPTRVKRMWSAETPSSPSELEVFTPARACPTHKDRENQRNVSMRQLSSVLLTRPSFAGPSTRCIHWLHAQTEQARRRMQQALTAGWPLR